MESMEQKLKDYFIEEYKPLAILLHGSRAIGKEREHSDWDFVFIIDKPNPEMRRKIIFGQNCEHKLLFHPVSDEVSKKDAWHLREGNVKIIYDPQGIGAELLSRTAKIAKNKTEWSKEDKIAWSAYVQGRIDAMLDYQNDDIAFAIKSGDMIRVSITLWFDIKKNWLNAPQVYESLPIIQKEDPEFFKNLEIMSGNYPKEEKVESARKIHTELFG